MAEVLQSAVRLPTPEPVEEDTEPLSNGHKRPAPADRTPSPTRKRRDYERKTFRAERTAPLPHDVDRERAMERARQLEERFKRKDPEQDKPLTAEEKQAAAKKEYQKLLEMRSGGTYIPPARLRALQEAVTDKSSKEYQRMAWEALKKSINGLVNKVNTGNIKHIVPELFAENLIRGRGLFCRSIMRAQAASLPFTPIFAAMAAIVNTKLPNVGALLGTRLTLSFRKAFRRNDKAVCLSTSSFIAHLVNQQVLSETLAAQILLLLLHKPTDDSVEIAVGFCREVGQFLEEMAAPIAMAVYDQFRSVLHESNVDLRTQYMIEVLFQVRKDKYKDNPAIPEALDLIEESDQITHQLSLDDDTLSAEETLNIFQHQPGPDYERDEAQYDKIKKEILGEASDEEIDDEEESSDDTSEDEEENEQDRAIEVSDQTNRDLVALRRTIYLTIKSSGGYEESVHKLLKINIPTGMEHEMASMLVEVASQERTADKFYSRQGERLCKLNVFWRDQFEVQFDKYYSTIHRFETNRLRIIASFFAYLLSTDSIGWHVFSSIHLNEDETTSSSRIFIKILFEEISQEVGMKKLVEKMKDDILQQSLMNIFPKDNSRNTRFSINFFTAIGMGALTEDMREWLKNLPKPVPQPLPAPEPEEDGNASDSGSYTSYSSYSSRGRSYSRSRSPTPRRDRGQPRARSYSDSWSRSRSRTVSRSRTPPHRNPAARDTDKRSTRRRRSPSYDSYSSRSRSRSRSPPARRGRDAPPTQTRTGKVGGGRARSYTPSDDSRSRSPPARHSRRRNISSERSASPPPARKASGRARRDDTASRSPPRRRAAERRASPPAKMDKRKDGRARASDYL